MEKRGPREETRVQLRRGVPGARPGSPHLGFRFLHWKNGHTGQIQYLLPTDVYVEGWKRTSLDPSLLGFGAFITFPASFCRAAPSVARVAGSSAAVVGGPGSGGSA